MARFLRGGGHHQRRHRGDRARVRAFNADTTEFEAAIGTIVGHPVGRLDEPARHLGTLQSAPTTPANAPPRPRPRPSRPPGTCTPLPRRLPPTRRLGPRIGGEVDRSTQIAQQAVGKADEKASQSSAARPRRRRTHRRGGGARSPRSRSRPTSWRSMRPSRRPAPARRAAASPLWQRRSRPGERDREGHRRDLGAYRRGPVGHQNGGRFHRRNRGNIIEMSEITSHVAGAAHAADRRTPRSAATSTTPSPASARSPTACTMSPDGGRDREACGHDDGRVGALPQQARDLTTEVNRFLAMLRRPNADRAA